jgi:hypothetical protein
VKQMVAGLTKESEGKTFFRMLIISAKAQTDP